jgi:hypothetical protein
MRRLALRALILAAALTTLAVPVFRMSGTPGSSVISTASACSVPGCVFTSTVTGAFNTFFSPITITVSSVTMQEFHLHGEQTTGVSLPGTLTLSVNDLRGNNEGFVVSVSSGGFSCTVPNFCTGTAIAASDLSVSSVTASLASCIGMCAAITGLSSAVGKTLDMPVAVAAQCPAELIGLGLYNISVGYTASLSASEAEAFTFFPASYSGTFSLSVDESAATVSSVAPTCPPPPTVPVTPTATVAPVTTVTSTVPVTPVATMTPTVVATTPVTCTCSSV